MSLKDKCMLVQLSISKPKMTAKDDQATTEVAVSKSAKVSAVKVTKMLYPKHLLAPIVTVESAARRYVESMTEARGKGLAVLPCKLFMEFQEKIGQFRLMYQQAVTVFLNNYASVMTEANQDQGTMFDTSEYPDVSELKSQFTFDVMYPTLETAGTITLQMEKEANDLLRNEVAAQQREQTIIRQRGLYARLGDAVKRIHTQCSNPEGKIYDTLTGNLAELLRILPALNLDDDQGFEALCRDASRLVVAPEAIKTVPEVRQGLAAGAKELMARMEAVMAGQL